MAVHTGTTGPPIRANNFEPEVLRQIIRSIVQTPGIVNAADLQVVQHAAGANMSVDVASGFAIVQGTNNSPVQGSYSFYNDATVTLTVAAADPTNPRIDIVCATVPDAFYSGASNTALLQVVTGTPAGSPSAPATPNNSVLLAQIAVAANVTSIVNANITDKRQTIGLNGSVNWNANSVGPMRDLGSASKWTPAGGPYNVGDMVFDTGYLGWWVCTVAGSPGTWKLQSAGNIRARMHMVGAQIITTGAVTLAMDTVDYDPNNNLSTGSHNYTAPIAGTYDVSWNVEVGTAASLTGLVAQLMKNASAVSNGSLALASNAGPSVYVSSGSDRIVLAANDLLTISASTFGANAAAGGLSVFANYLAVHYLGPT